MKVPAAPGRLDHFTTAGFSSDFVVGIRCPQHAGDNPELTFS